jgi:pyruvate dehydrogenase E2 component (dihydrolipoyllysine-residue acetyltransferase)
MSEPIQAITMPKWGLAMEEGMVVAWLADEGSSIEAGQDLLEIETTKITNVYEAPAAGTLRRSVVAEGETVPVGALLGLIADASVPDKDLDSFIERFNAAFAVKAAEAEADGPEPQTVTAGGISLNYLRSGAEGASPLVLIHGFGGDLNNWMLNQPVLSETHDVVALDLPGHGRSSKNVGAANMAMFTRVFEDFLDAMGIGQAHLVGHSLGGALALKMAIENPTRVAGLTVLAPAGLGPEINTDFIEGFIGAGKRKEMRAVLELLVADPALISRDMVDDVLKYKRLDGVDQALRQLAGNLFPGGRQAVIDPIGLARIPSPITVIWGRNDRILPVSHADVLPDRVAIHRLEGVGHMPHMEASAEVNRLIEATLHS